ncbi:MAG: SH3 domain-containing protein, partial [Aggregatilineales bacterium]
REAVDENFFNDPSDRTALNIVDSIQTLPLDVALEQWGIAVMNIQANVPNTLPGQAVTFIMLGESAVENAIAPEDVTADTEPITVVANTRANVRSGASQNNNVLGVADEGVAMQADAVNEARDWVRVVWRDRVGWVSTIVIDLEPDSSLDDLPVSTAPVVSPMQAFYFSTGFGQPACNEAPDVIGIHSPEGLRVDLGLNGINIEVGSFVTLKQLSDNTFALTVHWGHVLAETDDEIFTGETLVGELDENNQFVQWLDNRDATDEELALLDAFRDILPNFDIQIIDDTPQTNTGGSCSGLVATSPTLGLANGRNDFFWNAANINVTNYRVVVYNFGESRTATFDTVGAETNVSGNLTQDTIGGGFDNFAWEVQALVNGRVVCTSQRIANLQRAAVDVGPAGPGFSVVWQCAPPVTYSVEFVWSNLPASLTVDFSAIVGGVPTNSGPQSGSSGVYTMYTGGATATNGTATLSDGTVINLPGGITCL